MVKRNNKTEPKGKDVLAAALNLCGIILGLVMRGFLFGVGFALAIKGIILI